MKSLLIVAFAFASAGVVAQEASKGVEDDDISGVWHGVFRLGADGADANRVAFVPLNMLLTLYVLDLDVAGEEVEGTLVVGNAVDRRTAAERAMDALGLPGNEGPAAPSPRPITGTIDGDTLTVETTTLANRPRTITAKVRRDRMRAEIRTGPETRSVLLRRCLPSPDAPGECSLDALWAQYLEQTGSRPARVPTPEEIRRAVVPATNPETY